MVVGCFDVGGEFVVVVLLLVFASIYQHNYCAANVPTQESGRHLCH